MRILALAICLLTLAGARADAQCVGDCNGDGRVDITELTIGVNIVLGALPVADCEAFANDAGMVAIAQLVQGVTNALNGCPLRFVDNGDGTITDVWSQLMWEKKDQGGGVHDERKTYVWAGSCSGGTADDLCQPSSATESACNTANPPDGAYGCSQCGGTARCSTVGGSATIWAWLNQINAAHFAGHSDWRIPSLLELSSILDIGVPGCSPISPTSPCIAPAFSADCANGCRAIACSCTAEGAYYSSETFRFPIDAGVFMFFPAGEASFNKTTPVYVRAVRGGVF